MGSRTTLVAALLLSACIAPVDAVDTAEPGSPYLMPIDFRTAFTTGEGHEAWRSGSESILAMRIGAARPLDPGDLPSDLLRVVRLDTGEPIRGALRLGYHDVFGSAAPSSPYDDPSVSFIPDNPLEPGWYVLDADVRRWSGPSPPETVDGYMEDGHLYARFHVGSRPTWYETWIHCGGDPRGGPAGCRVVALLSERVEPALLAGTSVTVTIDGVPGRCTRVLDTFHIGIEHACPLDPPGTVYEVHLTSDLVALPDGAHDFTHTVVGKVTSGGPQHEVIDPRFGVDRALDAL